MKTIKFLLLTAILAILFSFKGKAQDTLDYKLDISVGYGVGNVLGSTYTAIYGIDFTERISVKTTGPFYFKLSKPLTEEFNIGASLAYGQAEIGETIGFNDSIIYTNQTTFSFLIRFDTRFQIEDTNLEFYSGVGIGYRYVDWDRPSNQNVLTVPVGFELTAGLKYKFTDTFGLYGEVGFAKSIIQGGIFFRL